MRKPLKRSLIRLTLTIILFDLGKRQHLILLVAGQVFDRGRRRDEFNCIRLSDDLTDILGLEILLADVARLVVKEAVRITHPCHSSEEYSKKQEDKRHELLAEEKREESEDEIV